MILNTATIGAQFMNRSNSFSQVFVWEYSNLVLAGRDYVWGKLDEIQVEYFDPFWFAIWQFHGHNWRFNACMLAIWGDEPAKNGDVNRKKSRHDQQHLENWNKDGWTSRYHPPEVSLTILYPNWSQLQFLYILDINVSHGFGLQSAQLATLKSFNPQGKSSSHLDGRQLDKPGKVPSQYGADFGRRESLVPGPEDQGARAAGAGHGWDRDPSWEMLHLDTSRSGKLT